jgi:hypothetical protein
MSAQPVAGWYESPTKAGQIQWWDGASWVENFRPAPGKSSEPEGTTGMNAVVNDKKITSSKVVNVAEAAGLAVAGAALAADGAIGLGQQRKGLHGVAKYFIWGSILFILGFVALIGGLFGINSSAGSPIPGAILIGLVAILLFVIGVIKLAVRAGSIAGGLLLLKAAINKGKDLDS